jgi:hypothetical protein
LIFPELVLSKYGESSSLSVMWCLWFVPHWAGGSFERLVAKPASKTRARGPGGFLENLQKIQFACPMRE